MAAFSHPGSGGVGAGVGFGALVVPRAALPSADQPRMPLTTTPRKRWGRAGTFAPLRSLCRMAPSALANAVLSAFSAAAARRWRRSTLRRRSSCAALCLAPRSLAMLRLAARALDAFSRSARAKSLDSVSGMCAREGSAVVRAAAVAAAAAALAAAAAAAAVVVVVALWC